MASTLSTTGPLEPELRLANAVSQFEASLSDGQKIAFRNQRTQSLQSPPSTKDVMRITAEIDISQKAGRRGFGPRFTKFLHGAQQFAALGDVIVGSSQNVVACGVWSVVRMCLLATTNRASYLESLSDLLMEAGQSTSQHSDMALLYPRSEPLQKYIIEFFIVVVQICLRYYQYTQKSALGKFTSSLNDSDIKEARSNLLFWSKSIQAEMTMLLARTIETEAELNSRFRAMMKMNSKSASQQQQQIILRNMLDRCSTHDYETTWRQIRKAGNTSLYTQMPEYIQWVTGPNPETLILVGKLGYGKSVTLANMVDDLNLRIDPGASGLAYFFCRHDLPESLAARTVIGALVHQIISPFPQRLADTEVVDAYDFPGLLNLMRRTVPPKHTLYIVLDGLDLCSSPERKVITEQLELLKTRFGIRTCISRRLEPEEQLQNFATEFPKAKTIRLPDNTPDIEAFVTAQLEMALSTRSLSIGDPTIILEIQNALLQGSQHMFLWVALQIQSLCTMQTDHDIRESLVDLPQDLSRIYTRILQQSKRPGRSLRKQIFRLILTARRPLTVQEMREALSVDPGNTEWEPARLLNSIYPALGTCGCLITVDEEELTIRTVHPSVDQFFLHDSPTALDIMQSNHFTMEDAQTQMSLILVTYLSYGVFEMDLAVRLPPLNIGPVPSHIIKSTTHVHSSVQSIALKLLGLSKKPEFNVPKALANGLKRHGPSNASDFHFQHYAKSFVLEHLAELRSIAKPFPDNVFRMFTRGTIHIKTYKEVIGLTWLMLQQSWDLDIGDLLKQIDLKADLTGSLYLQDTAFWRVFHWAIEIGRVSAVEFLLEVYRPILRRSPSYVHSPLRVFCENHSASKSPKKFRTMLLGRSPLIHAIENSQDLVAELLITEELVDLNETRKEMNPVQHETDSGSSVLRKPIGYALKQGNTRILELLLSQYVQNRLDLAGSEIKFLQIHARHLNSSFIMSTLTAMDEASYRLQTRNFSTVDLSLNGPNFPKLNQVRGQQREK
ncbi:unnamed protein product [Alternaria alternata]